MRHVITDAERHVFTDKDRSYRKGKKFGQNKQTLKNLAKYQPYAISKTKEEWLQEMREQGMSYYQRTRYAELLKFAKTVTYSTDKDVKIPSYSESINELKATVKQQQEEIKQLKAELAELKFALSIESRKQESEPTYAEAIKDVIEILPDGKIEEEEMLTDSEVEILRRHPDSTAYKYMMLGASTVTIRHFMKGLK